jgi:NADPH-dependent 7-cyano-7-deazaguanine reductase QueF-like protein
MVNIDIPKNYSASPSSFSGTPLLTINSDVAIDHDSSNAFEGASYQYLNYQSISNMEQDQRSC